MEAQRMSLRMILGFDEEIQESSLQEKLEIMSGDERYAMIVKHINENMNDPEVKSFIPFWIYRGIDLDADTDISSIIVHSLFYEIPPPKFTWREFYEDDGECEGYGLLMGDYDTHGDVEFFRNLYDLCDSEGVVHPIKNSFIDIAYRSDCHEIIARALREQRFQLTQEFIDSLAYPDYTPCYEALEVFVRHGVSFRSILSLNKVFEEGLRTNYISHRELVALFNLDKRLNARRGARFVFPF